MSIRVSGSIGRATSTKRYPRPPSTMSNQYSSTSINQITEIRHLIHRIKTETKTNEQKKFTKENRKNLGLVLTAVYINNLWMSRMITATLVVFLIWSDFIYACIVYCIVLHMLCVLLSCWIEIVFPAKQLTKTHKTEPNYTMRGDQYRTETDWFAVHTSWSVWQTRQMWTVPGLGECHWQLLLTLTVYLRQQYLHTSADTRWRSLEPLHSLSGQLLCVRLWWWCSSWRPSQSMQWMTDSEADCCKS